MRRYFALVAFLVWFAAGASCQQKDSPPLPNTGPWKISGRVVDAVTGAPLSHAEVMLGTPAKVLQTVVADADGRFLFEKLARGYCIVSAQHPGYIRELLEERDRYNVGIHIGPDAPQDLVLRLHRDASISGKVTDEQNEPVPNATVKLIQARAFNGRWFSGERASAITDEEGNYRLPHLPPGKYFIFVYAEPWYAQRRSYLHSAQKPVGPLTAPTGDQRAAPPALDVAYPLTFYPAGASIANASEIQLSSGNTFTADIKLNAVKALYAQVPFPDLDLDHTFIDVQQIVQGIWDIPVHVVTARVSPGTVEIGGLGPGRYRVATYLETSNQWVRKPGPAREIEIAGNLQITIKPEPARIPVTGQVEIEPGKSAKDVSVALRDQGSGKSYLAYAFHQGELEFKTEVPAGTYDVLLHGNGLFLQSVKAEGAQTAGLTVKVLPNSQPKLTFTATSVTSQIVGIAFKDDKPFTGAMMVLVPEDPLNNLQLLRIDDSNMDGSYAFLSVVPGRYTILALEDGWDLDWGDPKAWQPLVAHGTPIQVEPQKRIRFQAQIQRLATQR